MIVKTTLGEDTYLNDFVDTNKITWFLLCERFGIILWSNAAEVVCSAGLPSIRCKRVSRHRGEAVNI